MKLPNAAQAVVTRGKIADYLLNAAHPDNGGKAYEVEFTTLNGDTAAVVTVEAAQVRPVHKREITHARELQSA